MLHGVSIIDIKAWRVLASGQLIEGDIMYAVLLVLFEFLVIVNDNIELINEERR